MRIKILPDGLATALVFLTRFRIPSGFHNFNLADSLPWFGVTGFLTGILCTAASVCICLVLCANSAYSKELFGLAFSGALCWVCMEIWISKGLHWDGLADLADAVGSNAANEKFWRILKDSRIGVFGCLALITVFLMQWLAAAWHMAAISRNISFNNFIWENSAPPLFILSLATAWSRTSPLWLAKFAEPHEANSLGAFLCASVSLSASIMAWAAALICAAILYALGLSAWQACALIMGQILLTCHIGKLAKMHGGLSGDFFGAHIELSQTFFLIITI